MPPAAASLLESETGFGKDRAATGPMGWAQESNADDGKARAEHRTEMKKE